MTRTNKGRTDIKAIRSADACRALCLRMLSKRGYTEAELLRKLRERGADETLAEQTVASLRESGYIDDASFAESLVHYRSSVTHHGRYALRAELRRRGVEPELIENVLEESYDAEQEAAAAAAYLRRQLRRLRVEADEELPRERLYALLRKRGFSLAAVNAAFESLEDGEGE